MATRILREEIVECREVLYLEVETYGELKYMPRNVKKVLPTFGVFERTDRGTLLYSLYIGDQEQDWNEYLNNYQRLLGHADSHYCDDLRDLRSGNVTIAFC